MEPSDVLGRVASHMEIPNGIPEEIPRDHPPCQAAHPTPGTGLCLSQPHQGSEQKAVRHSWHFCGQSSVAEPFSCMKQGLVQLSACLCWHIPGIAQGTVALCNYFFPNPVCSWVGTRVDKWEILWVHNWTEMQLEINSPRRPLGAAFEVVWGCFCTELAPWDYGCSVFVFGILDLCLLCFWINVASVSWGKCENILSAFFCFSFTSFLKNLWILWGKPNCKQYSFLQLYWFSVYRTRCRSPISANRKFTP